MAWYDELNKNAAGLPPAPISLDDSTWYGRLNKTAEIFKPTPVVQKPKEAPRPVVEPSPLQKVGGFLRNVMATPIPKPVGELIDPNVPFKAPKLAEQDVAKSWPKGLVKFYDKVFTPQRFVTEQAINFVKGVAQRAREGGAATSVMMAKISTGLDTTPEEKELLKSKGYFDEKNNIKLDKYFLALGNTILDVAPFTEVFKPIVSTLGRAVVGKSSATIFNKVVTLAEPTGEAIYAGLYNLSYTEDLEKLTNDPKVQKEAITKFLTGAPLGFVLGLSASWFKSPRAVKPIEQAKLEVLYKELAKKYHPDVSGGNTLEAFTNINNTLAKYKKGLISYKEAVKELENLSSTPIKQTETKLLTEKAGQEYPTNAQMEAKAGWKNEGDKAKFDLAVLKKDSGTIKTMLPDVPQDYQKRFSKEIAATTENKAIQTIEPYTSGISPDQDIKTILVNDPAFEGVSDVNKKIGFIDAKKVTPRDIEAVDRAKVDKMKKDILAGDKMPIIPVTQEANGQLLTTEGTHRIIAYQELGLKAPIVMNTKGVDIEGLKPVTELAPKAKAVVDEGKLEFQRSLKENIDQAVNDEIKRLKEQVGGVSLLDMTDGSGKKIRKSANPVWYRNFYKDNKRAPKVSEWKELALENLKTGKIDGFYTKEQIDTFNDNLKDLEGFQEPEKPTKKVVEKPKEVKKVEEKPKEVKKEQVEVKEKPKEVSVPREQLPIGEGELKVSRLEARVKKTLDNVTPEQIEKLGLSTYKQMNNKDTIKAATEYVVNNPDDAFKVITGEIEPPKGLNSNSIFVAMSKNAVGNTDLTLKLASLKSTAMGQNIEILKELDPNNPVNIVSEVIKIKEKVIEKKTGKKVKEAITEEVEKIKKEVKKVSKYDWDKFIDSIKC